MFLSFCALEMPVTSEEKNFLFLFHSTLLLRLLSQIISLESLEEEMFTRVVHKASR